MSLGSKELRRMSNVDRSLKQFLMAPTARFLSACGRVNRLPQVMMHSSHHALLVDQMVQ
jgi:hypothetical protein